VADAFASVAIDITSIQSAAITEHLIFIIFSWFIGVERLIFGGNFQVEIR
jgi:hypothetical protein